MIAVIALAVALVAQAQESPDAIARFVAAVQAGADFKAGEFASVVIPEDAAKLAKIAKCIPAAPRTGDGGSVLIIWDCDGVPGGSSAGTGFTVKDDKITFLFVAPMTVVRTR